MVPLHWTASWPKLPARLIADDPDRTVYVMKITKDLQLALAGHSLPLFLYSYKGSCSWANRFSVTKQHTMIHQRYRELYCNTPWSDKFPTSPDCQWPSIQDTLMDATLDYTSHWLCQVGIRWKGVRSKALVTIYRQPFTFACKCCPVQCLHTPLSVINT